MGARREGGLSRAWGPRLGRGGCWQAALLAASILLFCNLPIHGQNVTILLKPSNPIEEGANISLIPQVTSGPFRECQWLQEMKMILSHKGLQPFFLEVGEAYSGRETMGQDCSLHIRGAVEEDSGTYTVMIDEDGVSSARGDVDLLVAAKLSRALLQPETSVVEENGEVTLTCVTSGSSRFTISWFKDGEPVPKTDVLSDQGQKLTLRNATREEAGSYTCLASNPLGNVISNPGEVVVTEICGNSQQTVVIVAGIFTAVLAFGISMLLYFWLRFRRLRRRKPASVFPTPAVLNLSAPPPLPPPPPYENVCPLGRTGPRVAPEISPENIYEAFQPGVRSVDGEVRRQQRTPQAPLALKPESLSPFAEIHPLSLSVKRL